MNAPFIWLIALPLVCAPLIYLSGRLTIADLRLSIAIARTGGGGIQAAIVNPKSKIPAWFSLVVMIAMWVAFALALRDFATGGPQSFTLGSVTLRLDGLSLLLAATGLGLGTLVVIFSGPYMAGEASEEKYFALLVALVGVMIGLGCANDLFNLWLWFEAMAVSSYLLVAFYHEQPASLEAGVKYLVQSAAGSILVLLGIALVLGQTGEIGLDRIAAYVAAHGAVLEPPLLVAGALFTIGFGVKAALVPLHTWLPDAHSQAPSGISAMLSGVVIEAGLVALLRGLAAIGASWGVLLMGFGALNMLAGNLLALRQTQVKRLLAFSSLAHVGYMLAGLGVALYAGQNGNAAVAANAAAGSFFHLLNHGLMKGLAFLAAGALLYSLHIARGSHATLTTADLAGAAKRYPLAALGLSVAVLGLGGLPPLAGFMSKWQIFVAGFQAQNVWISLLMIFAALNSVLSLGYYAPLVSALYRKQPSEAVECGKPTPFAMGVPLALMAVAVIVIGVWPTALQWLTGPAGTALMAAFGH
jgi:proton-translocating NADH-quinone oxidoreductase chain N